MRVEGATKQALLDLVADAVDQGWPAARACRYLGLPTSRYYRWLARGAGLDDDTPGGNPVHALLDWERAEILALFDEWGEVDRSHRKLAHRGSYLGRVWVSPATVLRVLDAADLRFRQLPRPRRGSMRLIPDWVSFRPNQIWIFDTTHFTAAGMAALFILDAVSRKWLATVVAGQETSIEVEVGFRAALGAEGIDELLAERDAATAAGFHGPHLPVLLAMSDNGPQMTSNSTAQFMALAAIWQHFGRPGTPTDQAQIESLNGHLKAEYPQLLVIRDAATLRAELDVVRTHYNTVRLHEGIGYVTPEDEHLSWLICLSAQFRCR